MIKSLLVASLILISALGFFSWNLPSVVADESHRVTFVTYADKPSSVDGKPTFNALEPDFTLLNGIDRGAHLAGPVSCKVNDANRGTGANAGDLKTAIEAGFGTWNSGSAKSLFSTSCSTSGSAAGTVQWADLGSTGVLAVTSLSLDTSNTVTSFTITFNNNPSFTWSTTGASGTFDLQAVATHESGHAGGLGHVHALKDFKLTMYFLIPPGATYERTLGCGDILGIRDIYGSPSFTCTSSTVTLD